MGVMSGQSSVPPINADSFVDFHTGLDVDLGRKLGAHALPDQDLPAVRFAVWAPNAESVSVVGEFNQWNPDIDPLFPLNQTGIWTTIVPGIRPGARYQYAITLPDKRQLLKSDPYARRSAPLPDHRSVVSAPLQFSWRDREWLRCRAATDWGTQPISIYEVHLGSWQHPTQLKNRPTSYRTIAKPLADYVSQLGFTHVLLMPLMEHPFTGSWGYQVTGFYAPTHRYGTPADLAFLVDTLHRAGIGVLLDWVPAHFAKDDFGLYRFDGTALYEHPSPSQGHHPDWGTAIFDWSKPPVTNFLISNAIYWLREYHFDGIRVDAVASMIYRDYSRDSGEWTPNPDGSRENLEAIQFLQQLNEVIGEQCPGTLRIAEESTAWPGVTKPVSQGGLGFDLKWNLGWMHDTLTYFRVDPTHRAHAHHHLTLPSQYQASENFCLPLSHDEVVHLKRSMLKKMPGRSHAIRADHLRALYTWMWAWPGKKLLFMGSEFGQLTEWDHENPLCWNLLDHAHHRGIQRLVQSLNYLYRGYPFLAETDQAPETFHWLQADDHQNQVFAFIREPHVHHNELICIGNFSDHDHADYPLTLPKSGHWRCIVNSSASEFTGIPDQRVMERTTMATSPEDSNHTVRLHIPARTTLLWCAI